MWEILNNFIGYISLLASIGLGIYVGTKIWAKCKWCGERSYHRRNCASLKPIIQTTEIKPSFPSNEEAMCLHKQITCPLHPFPSHQCLIAHLYPKCNEECIRSHK